MNVTLHRWTEDGWDGEPISKLPEGDQLVLMFGERTLLDAAGPYDKLRQCYPDAIIAGCSTAGDILFDDVLDNGIVATAISFASTAVHAVSQTISEWSDSYTCGEALGSSLAERSNLKHVLVFTEGIRVNGSAFIKGVQSQLPASTLLTGGMAAVAEDFSRTITLLNGPPQEQQAVALGFYGDQIHSTVGSMGGWDSFGPDRMITRAEGNQLYEFDGEPALELYKRYLGKRAADLPEGAMHFPLNIHGPDLDRPVVRTVVGIDEETGSLILTGDVFEGHFARLMKTNLERLIDGAEGAAENALRTESGESPDLALLISCFGRRFVMRQRVDEELDAVRQVMAQVPHLVGFYSFGEFCPQDQSGKTDFLNQTMTITTFREA